MSLARALSLVLSMFALLLVAKIGESMLGAMREHKDVRQAAALAEATTSWISGKVALSLERSVTQVAFSRDEPPTESLRRMIDEQRRQSDALFDDAVAVFTKTPALQTRDAFLDAARDARKTIAALRGEIDTQLALPRIERSFERSMALPDALKQTIDRMAIDAELLRHGVDTSSPRSAALLDMKKRAWEAREFSGRARTYYAIAVKNRVRIGWQDRSMIDGYRGRTESAWRALSALSKSIEPCAALCGLIEEADLVHGRVYHNVLDRLDAVSRATGPAERADYPMDFDTFFLFSNEALGYLEAIAEAAGAEMVNHWRERREQATAELLMNAAAALAALIAMLIAFRFVDRRVVGPLETVTARLTKVAKGDLEAEPVDMRRNLREIAALSDVLERFRNSLLASRALEIEARTDLLTGLPNRRDLEDYVAAADDVAWLGPNDAICVVDLDEFKPINDGFGHSAGDHVLAEISRRLLKSAGGSSEVWRVGGDEFVLIWRDVGSREQTQWRGDTLIEALCQPIHFEGDELIVGVSIGVALTAEVGVRPGDALSAADQAMYAAKNRPIGKVEVHDATAATRRFSLRQRRELEEALEAGRFKPFFQPQICLTSGRLVGFEALARWVREDGEVRGPGDFLGIIDRQQMQSQFDLAIVAGVLEEIARWRELTPTLPRVSINLSEETLASSRARRTLLERFEATPGVADLVTLEITEDALLDRSAEAIRSTLSLLQSRGIRLSMDDFGTGYGSFRHLREYRFHEMKIDRSFVGTMLTDPKSAVIVQGFITIARGLGAEVVAEGVETEAQEVQLKRLGCDLAQGYYYGRPLPAADAQQRIRDAAETVDAVEIRRRGGGFEGL